MSFVYIMVGGIAVAAFIFMIIHKRSEGLRALLFKLENDNNVLEIRVNEMEEERNLVQGNVAQLKGRVEAYEEALAAQQRAISEAALQQEQLKTETFVEFLMRTGVVTKEHLIKVKAYKEKNRSQNSVEELLIMLDFVSGTALQQAKAAYAAGRACKD
ncbi:hypothetical protein N1030_06245 [Desulfovibrio mangrovi]|uniref:hypothetical protein n=1 Tax=Desulfovibrio mangrovi TaxID=2976983 RepID=UPI002245380F|nr:hypothetical protein [Desulfovibrio mangrovi]UZP68569.1 hypothetical protein N1030_06245 [Desulfovibrio mangrovi]